ncbi:hypothetical protein [Moritella sp. JT01]|uniref:DUF6968 family protein n=1 Tax=Moritella sp. JT01 TaxID=756698 RepID=UPI0009FB5638|nr:hypothetical protein [Moritella sp. JT01]
MITSEYAVKQPDGSSLTLKVYVGTPEPDGTDYRCKLEIPELSFCEYAYGVDALQSLCMVVQCLKYVFEPLVLKGWKFYYPQDLERELDILSAYFPPQLTAS